MKSFENRLTFGEVWSKSLVSCFLTHNVYTLGSVLQAMRAIKDEIKH